MTDKTTPEHHAEAILRAAKMAPFDAQTMLSHPKVLSAVREAMEPKWLPIESAPKDGTFIFTFFQKTYERGQPDYFAVVKWGQDIEGWGDFGWLENEKLVGDPTHWQPLPTPPRGE
jgi:hypothetical protein